MEIEYSSRGFLTALFRQGKPFFAISLVIFLTGLAYMVITKPVYESSGSLVVKFGQATQAQGASDVSDASARQEIINSYIKIITGRDFLRDRIQAFGIYRLYPELRDKKLPEGTTPEALAIKNLLDNDLRVTSDQSRIIGASVRNHDPKVAAEFATQVLNAFVQERTEIYNLPRSDILQKQADERLQELNKVRSDYQTFKQSTGISDPDQETAQLLKQKSDLSTLAYTAVTQAQAKLADLESQRAKMEATYLPGSSMLAGLRSTIQAARTDLFRHEKELNSEDTKSGDSLTSTLSAINARIAYIESHRGVYNDLQQQVKMRDEIYRALQKQSEDARISNLLDGKNAAHIDIVDNPALPFEPVKPQKKIFLVITLLAALVSGFGTMLSRELLDDRLSNPEQVLTHIGVPVLAVYRNEIPYDSE